MAHTVVSFFADHPEKLTALVADMSVMVKKLEGAMKPLASIIEGEQAQADQRKRISDRLRTINSKMREASN